MNDMQYDELKNIIEPVIEYMFTHYHPQMKIIIDGNGAELTEGLASVIRKSYVSEEQS